MWQKLENLSQIPSKKVTKEKNIRTWEEDLKKKKKKKTQVNKQLTTCDAKQMNGKGINIFFDIFFSRLNLMFYLYTHYKK